MTVVQILSVAFDPTDVFYPLNLSRVQEIGSDLHGHIFNVETDVESEEFEREIEEEIVSETGLMVRDFSYRVVKVVA